MATKDSINPLLLTQKDWPIQFQFIRQKASFAKIQDYINPDKTENKIKENTKLAIPSIAVAPIAPATAPAASTAPAAAPAALAAASATPAVASITLAATLVSTRTATPRLLS